MAAQRPRRRRVLSAGVRVRMETMGRRALRQGTVARALEEIGAPGHEPDEEESPEEEEGDGVVVAGDAEVEVAEEMLVDEVEPEPAVDVAVGGEGDLPVVVGEGEVAGMALGGVGEGDEDVPGGGDDEED